MINRCRVCGKPLKRMNSYTHSGTCANLWTRGYKERMDHSTFFKKQIQAGFAWDEVSFTI